MDKVNCKIKPEEEEEFCKSYYPFHEKNNLFIGVELGRLDIWANAVITSKQRNERVKYEVG